MKVTVELSLYPMHGDVIAKILAFISDLGADAGIEVVVNQMSTQLRGELHEVMSTLENALERSFSSGDPQALVAKFLNADLPVQDKPDLSSD